MMKNVFYIICMFIALGNSYNHEESVSRSLANAQTRSLRAREFIRSLLAATAQENDGQTNDVGQQEVLSPEKAIFHRLNITSWDEIFNLTDWQSNDINSLPHTTTKPLNKELPLPSQTSNGSNATTDVQKSGVDVSKKNTSSERQFRNLNTTSSHGILKLTHLLQATNSTLGLTTIGPHQSEDFDRFDYVSNVTTETDAQETDVDVSKENIQPLNVTSLEDVANLTSLVSNSVHYPSPFSITNSSTPNKELRVRSKPLIKDEQGSNVTIPPTDASTDNGTIIDSESYFEELIEDMINIDNDIFEDNFVNSTFQLAFRNLDNDDVRQNVSTSTKQNFQGLLKNKTIPLENNRNSETVQQQKGKIPENKTQGTSSSDGVFYEGHPSKEHANISDIKHLDKTGNVTTNEKKIQGTGTLRSDRVSDVTHPLKENSNALNITNPDFDFNGTTNEEKIGQSPLSSDNVLDVGQFPKGSNLTNVTKEDNIYHHSGLNEEHANISDISKHYSDLDKTGNATMNEKKTQGTGTLRSDRVSDETHPLKENSNALNITNPDVGFNGTTNEEKRQSTLSSDNVLDVGQFPKGSNLTNVTKENNNFHSGLNEEQIRSTVSTYRALDKGHLLKDVSNVSKAANHHSGLNKTGNESDSTDEGTSMAVTSVDAIAKYIYGNDLFDLWNLTARILVKDDPGNNILNFMKQKQTDEPLNKNISSTFNVHKQNDSQMENVGDTSTFHHTENILTLNNKLPVNISETTPEVNGSLPSRGHHSVRRILNGLAFSNTTGPLPADGMSTSSNKWLANSPEVNGTSPNWGHLNVRRILSAVVFSNASDQLMDKDSNGSGDVVKNNRTIPPVLNEVVQVYFREPLNPTSGENNVLMFIFLSVVFLASLLMTGALVFALVFWKINPADIGDQQAVQNGPWGVPHLVILKK